ncbi:unnamed protein product [Dracunculus medinensis]|uniref:CX domain-containing protein n=1 Tax=Dracunculus medinensis TaxID=318479 RepID=A0A0N4U518_DRAME|nr:unnamed protein product [Dracunculus medinensis]
MESRWDGLPNSRQQELYWASAAAMYVYCKFHIHRYRSSYPNQFLCYYQNPADYDHPITYICELGCCSNGCCKTEQLVQMNSYKLALIMLLAFIMTVIIAIVALITIYAINRKRQKYPQVVANSFDSGSVISYVSI